MSYAIYLERFANHRRPPEIWRLWKNCEDQRILEVLRGSSCTHFGENLGRDFSDNWLHSRVTRKTADHILKRMSPKMYRKCINEQRKNQPKTEKIGVWKVFWEVWGPSWSHVEQAWQQKWKNARQKSPKMSNLVGIWRPSWVQNRPKNLKKMIRFLVLF